MTEFTQKRRFSSRKFVLLTDKIIIETKDIRKNDKYEAKLDQIGLDIYYQSDNTLFGKIFFGLCIAVLVGLTIDHFLRGSIDNDTLILNYIIWTFMACIAYLKPHQDDIFLVGGQCNLAFYRQVPSERSVLEFIEKVREQTKIYLREKYTFFDSSTSEEIFYGRINWLRDNEIISNSEYLEYKLSFDSYRLL